MNPKLEQWTRYAILVLMIAAAVGVFACVANGQPVSTITDIPDTVTTMTVDFRVDVASQIPWDQGGIGFYYRIPGVTGWLYIPEFSGTTEDLVSWLVPADNAQYELSTQVTDNEGNEEPYHQIKAAFYACTGCSQEDCPPLSTLELVSTLALQGFRMEPNEPNIGWHWLHATTGTDPIKFEVEWDVGGAVSFIDSVAVSDTTFSEVELPYTWGTYQLVRVRGVDTAGRTGPWSIWSQRWEDAGPPGAPGQPQGYLKMVGP